MFARQQPTSNNNNMDHYRHHEPPGYEESLPDEPPSTSVDHPDRTGGGYQFKSATLYDIIDGVSKKKKMSHSTLDRFHTNLKRYKGSLLETYNYLRSRAEPSISCTTSIESDGVCAEFESTAVDVDGVSAMKLPMSLSGTTLQYVHLHFQSLVNYALGVYWKVDTSRSSSVDLSGSLKRERNRKEFSSTSNATSYTSATSALTKWVIGQSEATETCAPASDISLKFASKQMKDGGSHSPVEAASDNSTLTEYCDENVDVSLLNTRMLLATLLFNAVLYVVLHSGVTKNMTVEKTVYLTSLDQLMIMVDD